MTAAGALALLLSACGGGTGTADTAASTAAPSTAPVSSSSSTEAVATTQAPTTTAAATSTLAPDAHPAFAVRWADVWPDETKSAVYRVDTFTGVELELPARMEYGVQFADGTYDRLVVGILEPGNDAMAIYFDRSEPWEIRVVGEEIYSQSRPDGPESVYVFDGPVVFNGLTPLGETQMTEGQLAITFGAGDTLELGVTYEVTPRSIESVTIAAGDFDDVLTVDAQVGGELIGGSSTFAVGIWLHADQFILMFIGASAFNAIELLEPWG